MSTAKWIRAHMKRTAEQDGCCLHVVLSDGNVEDEHVEEALKRAEVEGHILCAALAAELKGLVLEDRLLHLAEADMSEEPSTA